MKQTGIPNGIAGVGYHDGDIGALCEGAFAQQRLLTNSPRPVGKDDLAGLFRGAMRYW
jgi:alcohol dehydrogenase class IV